MKRFPWTLCIICAVGAFFSPVVAVAQPALRFSVEHMDLSVDPGVDFYRYACGGWLKAASIPDDCTSWSPTMALIRRNGDLLIGILEECRKNPSTTVERMVGDFYASAVDVALIERKRLEPIQDHLDRIEAMSSMEDLAVLTGDFQSRGIACFFELGVDADRRKSTTYIAELGQGGLNLPDRDYYLDPRFKSELKAYEAYVGTMFELAGCPKESVAGEVRTVLEIERAMAKASKPLEQLGDPSGNYHRYSFGQIRKLTPSFPWAAYWKAAGAPETDVVNVAQPVFFMELQRQFARRSLADWRVYLRWCLLRSTAALLHEDLERAHFAFFGTVLQGQPAMDPREKRAVRQIDRCLGEALGELYVRRHFSDSTRARVGEMVERIQSVFEEELRRVPWMGSVTRSEALRKFGRFRAKIGSPSKPLDYSSIEIRADDYFGNVERATRFEWERWMKRIGRSVEAGDWDMTAPTVNAYFKSSRNEIVFPAGILQPPFFDPELDDAVNYGATGATIGHELTHGYDNDGRKYDADGNLRDWWRKPDAKAFEARSGALVRMFGRYEPLPGVRVNGRLTLAENIADLGGVRIAYQALQRALEADPSKRTWIDGFSPEQRFFIAYAQSWASIERPQAVRSLIATDTHAPDSLRAYVPLLHMQEFYDAFSIGQKAKIYLPKERRVRIW